MKMIDIVKLFEEYVRKSNEKAVVILKRNLDGCSFKAYRKLTYTLYFTNRETGNGFELVTLDSTAKVTNKEEEDKLREDLDKRLLMWMFDFIRNNTFIHDNE